MSVRNDSAEIRFRSRIMEVPAPNPDLGPCWIWTRPVSKRGYALISADGRTQAAHRWAYEHWVGPIGEGLELDHLCRVRACVNPSHMEPVTHRENVLRGMGVAAQAARMTHCKYGHEFTPDNIRASKDGHRRCKTCKREASRAERARKKAADA